MRSYSVKQVFGPTLQGEGFHAGKAAVFVRFAGCNLWSGLDRRRGTDALANAAQCPLWCDTDFRGGLRLGRDDVVNHVSALMPDPPLIVLTGGEPLLQVDAELVDLLLFAFRRSMVCIETNGTQPLPFPGRARVWVTMSPKVPASSLKLDRADEVKVVFPSYDPADYVKFPAQHFFVSPQADPSTGRLTGVEYEAARYVMEHPHWRLSLQSHKVLGIP